MKSIKLYSKDGKYACAVELAETTDRYGCPDHSIILLTEQIEGKPCLIANAYDRILETEKEYRIRVLEKALNYAIRDYCKVDNELYEMKNHTQRYGIATVIRQDYIDEAEEEVDEEIKHWLANNSPYDNNVLNWLKTKREV